MLPLGVFRPPTEGWFVTTVSVFIALAGCAEDLRIYDLATGAAYLHRCTSTVTPAQVQVGRVSVAAIREAAWMAMLEETVEHDVRPHAQWFSVPVGIAIERRPGERVPTRRVFIDVSDTPVHTWSWQRSKHGALAGQVSGQYDVGTRASAGHAEELLDVADASFRSGCAPVAPPRTLSWDQLGPRVTTRSQPDDLRAAFTRLDQARAAIAAAAPGRGPCPPIY
jgi:hypothetical protein